MKMIMVMAACLCMLGPAAFAQEQQRRPAPGAMFQKMDTDGDDRISKDEAQKTGRKHLTENFDAIDANKDGFLSKAELKAFREKMQASRRTGRE